MRSIRRSLTVYLLILLVATLGLAGGIIYHRTGQTLEAREAATAELIEARYQEQCEQERKLVDDALLLKARELAGVMQTQYWIRYNLELSGYRASTGVVPVGLGTNPLAQLAWAGSANYTGTPRFPNPIPGTIYRQYFANLPLPEEFLKQKDEEYLKQKDDGEAGRTNAEQRTYFFQINSLGGRAWHSSSLEGRTLPFDPKALDVNRAIDWEYSPVLLAPTGERVRRVVLKSPLFNPPNLPPPRSPSGRPGTPPRGGWPPINPPTQQPPQTPENMPRIYVQVACPQAELDAAFARFQAERDSKLAQLRGQIRDERKRLQAAVLGIGLAAFFALAVGGPLLVGRGLAPVGKLSVAVSQVSEKDFNLPHDGHDLPAELAPIHARLTQTLDLLRQAFAREKQSVADISHELRTPIASLLATIDVTLRKPRTQDQYRTTLEECRVITKQLGQLVERIMTLATLDAGNARTVSVRIDGAELASSCATVIRPLAESHGLRLKVDAREPLELDTDPDKLREVLINLLHNAIEYNVPKGLIELIARVEDGSAVFEVKDTGIGMTPEVRERIFERFYRADASRTATGVHAGLGLAIVKEYVERLGGAIAVETKPGVGTTFRVTLSAAPMEPLEEPTSLPPPARAPRERVARAGS